MRKTYIKIYGERNTGTNYLQDLVKNNLEVDLLQGIMPSHLKNRQKLLLNNEFSMDIYDLLTYHKTLGWKHSLVKNNYFINKTKIYKENKIYFLTITKNPYSWLLSLYKRPYHQNIKSDIGFLEFLNRPWKSVHRENTNKTIKNPIVLWNIKNRSYIELCNSFTTINLTYENLILNPKKIIDNISEEFNLKKKNNFKNIDGSTKNDTRKFDDYQKYYLNELWRDKFTPVLIETINKHLDPDVLKYFNYSMIDPKSVNHKSIEI